MGLFWSYSLCVTPSHPQGPLLPLHLYHISFVFLPFPFFFFTLILVHRFQFMLPVFFLIKDHPLKHEQPILGCILKKSFSPAEVVPSSSVRDGNSRTASHSMVEGWLNWYGGGVVQANTAALSSWVNSLVMPRKIFHMSLSHSLALTMMTYSLSL